MMTIYALLLCLLCMQCCVFASTEFDNSLKPAVEAVTGSRTQKSVADIVAKATGKLDKSKAKQTAAKKESSSKRESFCSNLIGFEAVRLRQLCVFIQLRTNGEHTRSRRKQPPNCEKSLSR
jgi:hypothetical protein